MSENELGFAVIRIELNGVACGLHLLGEILSWIPKAKLKPVFIDVR